MAESDIQKAIMEWSLLYRNKFKGIDLLYHVPNGGKRNLYEAISLQKQGVKAGVPDLVLPVSKNGYHGLYMELKVSSKAKLSEHQEYWLAELEKQGYRAVRVNGFDEAIEEIKNYYKERRK